MTKKMEDKKMKNKQAEALTNARSIEKRVFTKEEHASSHCQVGNLTLAINYIIDWIDRKS
jgi:hypothetical protein|uniref:Uncharacterized protein n=1 Tax=Candidatus Methanophagaceae archaeon ANME-1 ERB6 TaxID=2759912 RepID=A0A7G9YTT0_9EURY|nr:hypothetical protein GZ27E6_14 [uncultured archaeon GZfos27E6]QNO51414.1 hypothetical protein PFCPEAIJ_00016 [Methanosarcinales archaeon ANME-1 ERB6]QNO53027.1 hypothetical protein GKHFHOKN_00003 [Methanosarcinales archaeon ANME-1 ERB6]